MDFPFSTVLPSMAAKGPMHPASRVPMSQHDPRTLRLLTLSISLELLDYVIDCAVDLVRSSLLRQGMYSSNFELKSSHFCRFVTNLVVRSRVPVATVLVTLSYLDRCRNHLEHSPFRWSCESIFFGAFMVAHKYTNDSWMRALTWAQLTGIFTSSEVVRVEREFLSLLDYNLGVREHDLLHHYNEIIHRCTGWYSPPKSPNYSPPSPFSTGWCGYVPAPPSPSDCSSQTSSGSSSPLDSPVVTTPPLPPSDPHSRFNPTYAVQGFQTDHSHRWGSESPSDLGRTQFTEVEDSKRAQSIEAAMDQLVKNCYPVYSGLFEDSLMYDGGPTLPPIVHRSDASFRSQQQLPHISEILPPLFHVPMVAR